MFSQPFLWRERKLMEENTLIPFLFILYFIILRDNLQPSAGELLALLAVRVAVVFWILLIILFLLIVVSFFWIWEIGKSNVVGYDGGCRNQNAIWKSCSYSVWSCMFIFLLYKLPSPTFLFQLCAIVKVGIVQRHESITGLLRNIIFCSCQLI